MSARQIGDRVKSRYPLCGSHTDGTVVDVIDATQVRVYWRIGPWHGQVTKDHVDNVVTL